MRYDPKMPIWERQPGESSAQYVLFVAYRDAGYAASLIDVYRGYANKPNSKHPPGRWTKLSSENEWVPRRTAYWAYVEKRVRASRETDLLGEQRKATDKHLRVTRHLFSKMTEAVQKVDSTKLSTSQLLANIPRFMEVERALLGQTNHPDQPAEGSSGADPYTGGSHLEMLLHRLSRMDLDELLEIHSGLVKQVELLTEVCQEGDSLGPPWMRKVADGSSE